MLADRHHRQPGSELALDEICSALGEEHLAAVAGAHDPGGAMDVHSGVEAVGVHGLAGVEADPNADRL